MTRIGFIGLGVMGRPMAANLLKAGYALVVHDRHRDRVEALVALGARPAASSRAVAEQSDIVITMLPNSPDVREVILGGGGVLEGARAGLVLVDMSSIAPLVSRELCARLEPHGVSMLDAPVSGGEPKAIAGTLGIMVGGRQEVFDRVKDILAAMGSSVVLVGGIGAGNTAKLANQVIVALNLAAMSEAMVLATKAGVEPEKVYQAIRGGLAGSSVLDAKMPLVLERRFTPGFRIDLHIKDLANALETGQQVGAPLPLAGAVIEILRALQADGKGGEDHGGIVQYHERLAGIEVRR